MMGKMDDITILENHMKNVLHNCKLDSMVTVETIKRWMTDLDFKDKETPIYMITGLVDDDVLEQPDLLKQLIDATLQLYHVLPLPSLDGQSFQEVLKKRTEQNIPTKVYNHQSTIPPRDWFKPYYEAMQLMHQQQFSNACDKFDEMFQKLLKSKTTDPNIYRIFCNAGLAYLLSGRPYLGAGCISLAKELNPKYTYAEQQLQKIEQGDFNKLVELGLMMKMMHNMQQWGHRKDHLNLDNVMNWSEKKILKKLSSYGITVNKEEFIRTAQTVNNAEDVAEQLFYPKASVSPDDEDFIWIAACALWEKYCPNEQSIHGFRQTIHNAYTFILTKDLSSYKDTTQNTKDIKQLHTHLQGIHDYVFSKKKDLLHQWNHMLDIDDSAYELREFLTTLLCIPPLKDKVVSIVHQLTKQDLDPYWDYITIINQIQEDPIKGRNLFKTTQEAYPYYCHNASDIGLYFMDQNDYDTAETYLLDALAIIDNRAEDKKYAIDFTFSTIYDDYKVVFDHLEQLYTKKKPDTQQRKWLKKKRKQIEKQKQQLSYSPHNEKLDEALSERLYQHEIEEAENSYPMQYYEFLSQFNINFETEKPVKTTETYLSIDGHSIMEATGVNQKKGKGKRKGKKVGRNDPCPCGSGKKYKKCCGSITKK